MNALAARMAYGCNRLPPADMALRSDMAAARLAAGPALSIVIVNWNTRDLLTTCLESLYAFPPGCPVELIVVDNASTDGSAEMVRQQFPHVTLLRNEANRGFAAANNQALRSPASRYVLLLNPDTEVRPGAIDALLTFMDAHPDAGAVGARLLNPDGSLQVSCFPLPTLTREFWRLFHLDRLAPYSAYPADRWQGPHAQPVDTAQGACLLLRREALEQAGLLDDGYFIYSEEVDLCRRLWQHGWSIWWLPQAEVVHYGGQSTRQVAPAMFLQLYRAKVQYFRKHYGRLAAVVYKLVLASASVARVLPGSLIPSGLTAGGQAHRSLARLYRRLLTALPSM